MLDETKAYCFFCGSTVGQESERTDELVTAVYFCERCERNYCDQCSYEEEVCGVPRQLCMRCDNPMKKVG